ncbi:MAG: class I SAM-dependent methyltransferase [Bacteroidetes bacterium]|nr:class I SAM-dependent methyltransferase [Bacteroidota bacterium]
MSFENDPIGLAIQEFERTGKNAEITVSSDLCEDDVIPVAHFFRTYDEMPELEQRALALCTGSVLDVGAGAGCHSAYLLQKKLIPEAIDVSKGAVGFMTQSGINASQKTIFELHGKQFDTILLLMNGIGLAGSMAALPEFLTQLKKLLNPGGKILCDSTDISYLYAEEDGSLWINLNDTYYGEMQFNMTYQNTSTGWFPWLYIDFENLCEQASLVGLNCTLLFEGENNHYLVSLEHS